MAFADNELFESPVEVKSFPSVIAEKIQPKTFAGEAGADLLALLTPLGFNTVTGFWEVWADAGANGIDVIRAFVWADPVQLDAADEVIGNVLMAGTINYDDIVLPSGELVADLKAALQSGLRERGILIQNLVQVR